MKGFVLNDHQAIAQTAAKEIADAIKAKEKKGETFVLGLATGSTMEPVYAELIKMYDEKTLNFSHVRFFNLDNYVGLPRGDRNNYETQLHKLFLNPIHAHPEHVHLVSSDEDFDHQAYEALISAAGGIDIQLLGLGSEGHIGFNEVGSSIDSPTRTITLSQKTKDDNGKYFNQIDKASLRVKAIPSTAHTRGIAPILEAKRILFLANGHAKAYAIRETFQDGLVEDLPARALLSHPNVTTLVDKDALALFTEGELAAHTDLDEPDRATIIQANQSHWITLNIQGEEKNILLPPQFDFYDPHTMHIEEPFNRINEKHCHALATCLEAAKHTSVGAHPDDAEIMAGPMMLEASGSWLTIIVTNGAATNNTLNGKYRTLTAAELTRERQMEQRRASQYAGTPVIMCKFPTPAIRGDMDEATLENVNITLSGLFHSMPNLEKVHCHHPLDAHDTHAEVFAKQAEALRTLSDERLKQIEVLGMEVWGPLHIADQRLLKITIEDETLLTRWETLISFYQSQIEAQGRDYSKTTVARSYGHAGYQTHPHGENPAPGLLLAIRLTDLVANRSLSIIDMITLLASELIEETMSRANMLFGSKHSKKNKPEQRGATETDTCAHAGSTANMLAQLGGSRTSLRQASTHAKHVQKEIVHMPTTADNQKRIVEDDKEQVNAHHLSLS